MSYSKIDAREARRRDAGTPAGPLRGSSKFQGTAVRRKTQGRRNSSVSVVSDAFRSFFTSLRSVESGVSYECQARLPCEVRPARTSSRGTGAEVRPGRGLCCQWSERAEVRRAPRCQCQRSTDGREAVMVGGAWAASMGVDAADEVSAPNVRAGSWPCPTGFRPRRCHIRRGCAFLPGRCLLRRRRWHRRGPCGGREERWLRR